MAELICVTLIVKTRRKYTNAKIYKIVRCRLRKFWRLSLVLVSPWTSRAIVASMTW